MIWDAPDWISYLTFREQIAEAVDETLHPMAWVDEQVRSGVFRVFASRNAIILAKIETYPSGAREVHGIVAAGDLNDIKNDLIPQALRWGKLLNCIAGRIESRPGWARELKGEGWEMLQLIIRKAL